VSLPTMEDFVNMNIKSKIVDWKIYISLV
jgi:hypothetical protein